MKKLLFIVANDGLHPINSKIRKQFENPDTQVEIKYITEAMTPISQDFAKSVAVKAMETVKRAEGFDEVYFIPCGLQLYSILIFNVIQKVINKSPYVLFYRNELNSYEIFDFDVRKIIFS